MGGLYLDVERHFRQLHLACSQILEKSLSGANAGSLAKSLQFADELESWCQLLGKRREAELVKVGALELRFAILALTQGHYRHAFNGLRLVLELMLQAVYLSTNEVLLREWLENRLDTTWATIINQENGVFSRRVARAFFPDLTEHVQHYQGVAAAVYRECSECVHGNIPRQIPLPASLAFDQTVFDLWCSKAEVVALVVHFALSMRYLLDIVEHDRPLLESFLSDRLGHVKEIRALLGGPTEA